MSNGIGHIYDYDLLQAYFRRDYHVTDCIKIIQPTIGQIVDYGENFIYSLIFPFVTNPTACRVVLWDNGIDWNKITEYELFLSQ